MDLVRVEMTALWVALGVYSVLTAAALMALIFRKQWDRLLGTLIGLSRGFTAMSCRPGLTRTCAA